VRVSRTLFLHALDFCESSAPRAITHCAYRAKERWLDALAINPQTVCPGAAPTLPPPAHVYVAGQLCSAQVRSHKWQKESRE
jgi:hypothetical protein